MCSTKSNFLFSAGIVVALTCCAWPLRAQDNPTADAPSPQKIFLIGNSLTWDTLPGLLTGDVQWHVDCGKNLKFIYENPQSPCVKTSTLWPTAFAAKQYDVLCIQPHFGTSLDDDIQAISKWLELQPKASLVIHTGWNRSADFEKDYHAATDAKQMIHAPKYFEVLVTTLSEKYPNRSIRTTSAIQTLDLIWHDIKNARAPFKSFEELYRDNIHMTTQVGRYLMHNLMRMALDQPRSGQGFQLEQSVKDYLDGKLAAVAAAQKK